ncbi:hypothetical protein [Streptomyces flaveolus]|uniref:Uncharacterized protein n=1 Tax=Streptomyces flaveolus TaxID=67297 RepID=A0ABV3A4U0_9ACTN
MHANDLVAESVAVVNRSEVGSDDAPALTQRLRFSALVGGVRRDLMQSQVYLVRPDRAVVDHSQAVLLMGLFDLFTGTRRPDSGVAARSPGEVRAALLAVGGPDVPYTVREGAADGAELVAEWRVREPAWHTFFARTQVSRTLEIRMRLVPGRREVRALDREWEVTWVGETPRLALSKEQSRGQVRTVSRRWTVDRGSDGRLRMTEDFRFDSAELKTPLQEAVLRMGWIWRGALFKL